jgi:hypothetical protein
MKSGAQQLILSFDIEKLYGRIVDEDDTTSRRNIRSTICQCVFYNHYRTQRDSILATYSRPSRSIFSFDKAEQRQSADSKNELEDWLAAINDGIPFPQKSTALA